MEQHSEQDLQYAAEFREGVHAEALERIQKLHPEIGEVVDKWPVEAYFQEHWDYPGKWYTVVAIPAECKSRKALVDAIVSDTLKQHGISASERKEYSVNAKKLDARHYDYEKLFAPAREAEELNYRGAFLHPPHGCRYTDADFDRVNAALFLNGTDDLEVYRWTTDWSDYFDDGHEWWGTLCLTVYDKSTDRFAVLLASATDRT